MEVLTCDKQCSIKGHEKAPPELILTPDKKHYGNWVCGVCGKYIVHSKTPKTCADMAARQDEIVDFLFEGRASKADIRRACALYGVGTLNYGQRESWDILKSIMSKPVSPSSPPVRPTARVIKRATPPVSPPADVAPQGVRRGDKAPTPPAVSQ